MEFVCLACFQAYHPLNRSKIRQMFVWFGENSEIKCPFGWQCLHCSGLVELKRIISLIIQPHIGLSLKAGCRIGMRTRSQIPTELGECGPQPSTKSPYP